MTISKSTQRSLTPVGEGAWGPAWSFGPNWLLCDGSTYNNADYPLLYASISTTYGTGGGSTFKVPNCVDRVLVGFDTYGTAMGAAGRNTSSGHSNYNGSGGAATVTLSVNEIPNHTHSTNETAHGHTLTKAALHRHTGLVTLSGSTPTIKSGASTTRFFGQGLSSIGYANSFNSFPAGSAGYSHSASGGGEAHENEQPYIGLQVYIRAW